MIKKIISKVPFLNKGKKELAEDPYFLLGHMVKYNIYLLSKSIIISAIGKSLNRELSEDDISRITSLTNTAIAELDSANKQ